MPTLLFQENNRCFNEGSGKKGAWPSVVESQWPSHRSFCFSSSEAFGADLRRSHHGPIQIPGRRPCRRGGRERSGVARRSTWCRPVRLARWTWEKVQDHIILLMEIQVLGVARFLFGLVEVEVKPCLVGLKWCCCLI